MRAEFLRESKDGRITLVLHKNNPVPVRALWAIMDVADYGSAIAVLGRREGIPESSRRRRIGLWKDGDDVPEEILDLPVWAKARSVDAVVWTALPPKFDGKIDNIVGAEVIVRCLSSMTGASRDLAERYIRYAPPQIDTPYRRAIEAALGWTPQKPPAR